MEFDHYAIDAGLSTLSIRAFASSAFAVSENSPTLAIREFAGWARFVPRTFDQAYVHTKVNPGSLTVVESIAEEDRNAIEHTIRRSVLEIDKYPEVVFC